MAHPSPADLERAFAGQVRAAQTGRIPAEPVLPTEWVDAGYRWANAPRGRRIVRIPTGPAAKPTGWAYVGLPEYAPGRAAADTAERYPGLHPARVEVETWHPKDRAGYQRWTSIACVLAVAAGLCTALAVTHPGPWPSTLALEFWVLTAMALWWALDVYGPR